MRLMRGKTQKEVSESLGVSVTTYISWEKNNTVSSHVIRLGLCSYFGYSEDAVDVKVGRIKG